MCRRDKRSTIRRSGTVVVTASSQRHPRFTKVSVSVDLNGCVPPTFMKGVIRHPLIGTLDRLHVGKPNWIPLYLYASTLRAAQIRQRRIDCLYDDVPRHGAAGNGVA